MADDTPIDRADISSLSDDELEAMLLKIRERRLRLLRLYEEAKALQDARLEQDKREELEDALSTVTKDVERVEKAITKVEAKINKIRALRLEFDQ